MQHCCLSYRKKQEALRFRGRQSSCQYRIYQRLRYDETMHIPQPVLHNRLLGPTLTLRGRGRLTGIFFVNNQAPGNKNVQMNTKHSPSRSTCLNMSLRCWSEHSCPRDDMTALTSSWEMLPSLSLSNSEKASRNSETHESFDEYFLTDELVDLAVLGIQLKKARQ